MKKILAGTAAALVIAAAIPLVATAGHGDRGGHGMPDGHGGGHGMRGHHGGEHRDSGARLHLQEMLETYDADGDGGVTQSEIDEWRANRLREFDTDGNGQLSLDEYRALWLDAMRERMVDQFQAHDDDGDAQVTADEFGERTSRLVMVHDRNDDGVLNLEDTRGGRGGDRPGDAPQEDGGAPVQPGGSGQDGATQQQ
jgi:Ca2+-binding EF-hand superfamily protein